MEHTNIPSLVLVYLSISDIVKSITVRKIFIFLILCTFKEIRKEEKGRKKKAEFFFFSWGYQQGSLSYHGRHSLSERKAESSLLLKHIFYIMTSYELEKGTASSELSCGIRGRAVVQP